MNERPRAEMPANVDELYEALWEIAVDVHDQIGFAMDQQRHPLARFPHRKGCSCGICELRTRFERAAELYAEAFPGGPFPWDVPGDPTHPGAPAK